jgi:hypothetical protein
MSIQWIPEQTIAAMTKEVISGDYRKFFRLGAVTLAGIFGGRIAEAAVEGILNRIWKRADEEKARAAATVAEAAEIARISGALRDALRAELLAIVEKLDALRDGQLEAHQSLTALSDLAARSAEDIAHIRAEIDALTKATAVRAEPPEDVLIHLAMTAFRVPPFSDGAEIIFTVHNFTRDTLKLRELTLTVIERTEIAEVQLARAGEPIQNYELRFSLIGRDAGTFSLLTGVNDQFVLKPDDADGFRLKLACDDGYSYVLALSCTAENVRSRTEWMSAPVTFDVTAPITRPETLRARKRA